MTNATKAIQFETQFPINSNVKCNDLETFMSVMSDINGFLAKNGIELNQYMVGNGYVFITQFMSVPRTIVVMDDKIIITTYYETNDTETMVSEIRWNTVRRIIASLIRAVDN